MMTRRTQRGPLPHRRDWDASSAYPLRRWGDSLGSLDCLENRRRLISQSRLSAPLSLWETGHGCAKQLSRFVKHLKWERIKIGTWVGRASEIRRDLYIIFSYLQLIFNLHLLFPIHIIFFFITIPVFLYYSVQLQLFIFNFRNEYEQVHILE
jgi:hypothetical protein